MRPADGAVPLVDAQQTATIVVDDSDFPVVKLAAGLFADDVERVTHRRPPISSKSAHGPLVIVGTLGHSAMIDQLAAHGKIQHLDSIRGGWEKTLWQVVEKPYEGVDRALVIVGSDRRGAAYGLMQLSEKIGVSPWYWWADVPAKQRDALYVTTEHSDIDSPAVRYRGIFINDEDWGLNQWARNTFEPEFKSIGPKTYEKVFELLLRLRLNYIWPAMHECTREFNLVPENIELADRYAIVAGASHCEPMLFNNAKWDEGKRGKWDYSINRDTIYSTWENETKTRGNREAVWGLGIRGIHDRGMQGPDDPAKRIGILHDVFRDQVSLLDKNASKSWGPVAKCFVPYKEVLPLYDAGVNVPEDATLVWVDDNFGYIRRLSNPKERERSGGAGVYWHLSYYGFPHSYLWINTTPPALMWEELHKAWENDARRLWVINVGDIKPAEIGIDYFSKLAWNPEAMGPESQPKFLRSFAAEHFGDEQAGPIAELLTEFYRLGTIRKPEMMNRGWAINLTDEQADRLTTSYTNLVVRNQLVAQSIVPEARDAYFEMIGFPATVLGRSGQLFMADRGNQFGSESRANQALVDKLRGELEAAVDEYNNHIAGGKWKWMMPGIETAKKLTEWNSQVRWPWGEEATTRPSIRKQDNRVWRDAASTDRQTVSGEARWTRVSGLGQTGQAMALKPTTLESTWRPDDASAPTLDFDFESRAGDGELSIDFLPTFRLVPGMKLRVAVILDEEQLFFVEVPGSSGAEDENGPNRNAGVRNNFVRATVLLPGLSAGMHTIRIRAVDPGAVIDRVALPN